MNIFTWLKGKVGKMPVSVAQAAGITAVVGAAGLAALSYLSGPSEDNNTFIPPSAYEQPGEVVYISQNTGGGQYEMNGEIGSSFRAAPSRYIQLANQQEEREQRTRALEDASAQPIPVADEQGSGLSPKAYQMSGSDLGKGLGGGVNKDTSSVLDSFANIKDRMTGLADVVNKAQANANQTAAAGQPAAGAKADETPAPGSGFTRAASHSWSNSSARGGGLSGGSRGSGSGGSGSANTFVVQDSGKNTRSGAGGADMGQVNDALAQARAAMNAMNDPREGNRLAAARFGDAEGLNGARNSRIGRGGRFGGEGGTELERIRKHTAQIAANKTNSANEAGRPFLSSNKLSGGVTVSEGDSVNTGQGASSSDLSGSRSGNFGAAWGKVQQKMDDLETTFDEQKLARDELKMWLLQMVATAMAAMMAVAILVKLAKVFSAIEPWGGIIAAALYVAAAVVTIATLYYIWKGADKYIGNYIDICGKDAWSTFGWILSGIMTGGMALAWIVGPSMVPVTKPIYLAIEGALAVVGMGAVGHGLSDILKSDPASAEADKEDIEEKTEGEGSGGGGN